MATNHQHAQPTTTPQTFLELQVHLKRFQVHLLWLRAASNFQIWHIFFVISPHFEKKRFHFLFFLPANDLIYVYDTAQERQYIAQERQYIRSG